MDHMRNPWIWSSCLSLGLFLTKAKMVTMLIMLVQPMFNYRGCIRLIIWLFNMWIWKRLHPFMWSLSEENETRHGQISLIRTLILKVAARKTFIQKIKLNVDSVAIWNIILCWEKWMKEILKVSFQFWSSISLEINMIWLIILLFCMDNLQIVTSKKKFVRIVQM